MSPSTYLITIPLSVIAVSGWLVKMEGDSFASGRRTSNIQQVPRHGSSGIASVPQEVPAPQTVRLDHDRYGWDGETGGSMLGADVPRRPLGSRPSRTVDWLDQQMQQLPSHVRGAIELPDIPGFVDTAQPAEPSFETVPAGSGFHISADEATKLDLGRQSVTFNGHVKLSSPQFHLNAKKLVVHLGKDQKSFRLMEASGSVDVQLTGVPDDKKYRGQSETAVYDPAKGTLVMSGWPKIQGSGQELVAAEESTKVLLFPKTGKMLTEGRAQTRVARRLMAEGEEPAAASKNP